MVRPRGIPDNGHAVTYRALLLCSALALAVPAHAETPPLLEPDLFGGDLFGDLDDEAGVATDPPACRIVFDGRTGGISSGRMELGYGEMLFAWLQRVGGSIADVRSGMGSLYHDGRYLWTEDGRLSSAVAFLDSDTFEVVDQVDPAPLILTDLAVMLQGVHDPDHALLDHLEQTMADRHGYGDAIRLQGVLTLFANERGEVAWVAQGPGMAPDAPLETDPLLWEVRSRETVQLEAAGQGYTLHQLSRMTGEGTRRKALVDDLLSEADVPVIYVSAGGVVEGRSFLPGQDVSLMRPLTWQGYADTGLRLLAPGRAELLRGLDPLVDEAEEAHVTLLAANLRDAAGDMPFAGAELVQLGNVQVAFVGVVDPAIAPQLEATVRSGMDFDPPAPAVERALHTLRAGAGADPDLVVLLAGFEAHTLGELVRDVADVDVVLGDFGAAVPLSHAQQVVAEPRRELMSAADRRPMLVVHASGTEVGELEVRIAHGTVASLTLHTHPITQLLPADDDALREVMAIRHPIYLEGEPVLVPDLRELVAEDVNRLQFLMDGQPYRQQIELEMATGTLAVERLQLRMTRQLWSNLAANLLLRRSGADVVVLPPLPWPFEFSGATRDLYATSYLAVPDTLQVVELSGAQLRELLRLIGDGRLVSDRTSRRTSTGGDVEAETRTGAPWVAGLDPSHGKVGGRPLGSGEVYRVLTTSALADYAAAAPVLGGARKRTGFRGHARGFRASQFGEPLTLRSEVLGALHEARAAHPGFGAAYRAELATLMRERGQTVHPLVYLYVDTLGLTFTRYLAAGDHEAYANVLESRITTPDSFSFGMRAELEAGLDTRNVVLSSSADGVLTVSKVGDADPDELEDDLRFALDLGMKALSVREAPIYPFLQGSYDTEFMRADQTDDAGEVIGKHARQMDLRGTIGVTATNLIPTVTAIKVGNFLEYDFAAFEGALESGMSLEIEQKLSRNPVVWGNTLKLYGWFPHEDDTDEDLLLSLNYRTELGVLIFGNLQFKVYGDFLAYRGKVEATAEPGLSTIVGVELAWSGRFRRRLW